MDSRKINQLREQLGVFGIADIVSGFCLSILKLHTNTNLMLYELKYKSTLAETYVLNPLGIYNLK